MLLFVHMPGLEDKSKKSKAERIAFDLLEYLDQINYNKYYDSMGSPGTRGGEKEKLFSDFSSQSIKAAQASPHHVVFKHQQLAFRLLDCLMQGSWGFALLLQVKLKQFLALMPADDNEAAQVAANGGYF